MKKPTLTRKKKKPATYAAQLIGTVNLGPDGGRIDHPLIKRTSIVLFNAVSPDELEHDSRVVLEDKFDGWLRFSTRNSDGQFTYDEPMVHFAVFDGEAPGVINPIMT